MALSRNPFSDPSVNAGPFRPQLKPAPKQFCFVCVDPGRGADTPVPEDTIFIWDTLSLLDGIHRPIKGRYGKLMVPLGSPCPQPPLDGGDPDEWKIITESQVWLDGFDGRPPSLRVLSVTGELALNALSGMYKMMSYKAELQAGKIPVMRICECEPYENGYGRFGIPVVEPIDFIVRDQDMFSSPIIRPPMPILGSSYVAPPMLPHGNDNGPAADVVTQPPPPPVVSAPLPETEPVKPPQVANDDVFARYRPAGAGKKPY